MESKWVPALPTPIPAAAAAAASVTAPGPWTPVTTLSAGPCTRARWSTHRVRARCQPFQSGRLRLRDLQSLGFALPVFHSADGEALSMVVSIILYWCVLSLIHSTNTYYFITRHLLNPGDTSPSLGGAHSLAEKSHSQIINSSQVGLHYPKTKINRIKDKNCIIILIDAGKKIQYLFQIKTSNKPE